MSALATTNAAAAAIASESTTPVSAPTAGVDTTQEVPGEKKAPAPGDSVLVYDDNEISVVGHFRCRLLED